MMKRNKILFGERRTLIVVSLLLFIASSCAHLSDKEISGIVIPKAILSTADEYGVDYCELIDKSLSGNETSLRLLIYMDYANIFKGENCLQHKAVVTKIIRKKGEAFFIEKMRLKYDSLQNKKRILDMINDGLNYEHHDRVENIAQNEFPKIYEVLTTDTTDE